MGNSQSLFTWYYNSSLNDPLSFVLLAAILFVGGWIIYYNVNLSNVTVSKSQGWNWLYKTSNNNASILFVIILLLMIGIYVMGWYQTMPVPLQTAKDKFVDTTEQTALDKLFVNEQNIAPITPTLPSYQISVQDRNKWIKIMSDMEKNASTVVVPSDTSNVVITQKQSTLYGESDFIASYDNGGNSTTANVALTAYNGTGVADYATLDSLGKSLTDSLGGIEMDKGFAVISETLGTSRGTGLRTYDNTQDYRTRMIPEQVQGLDTSLVAKSGDGNGKSKYSKAVGSPLFLQKDFAGVANIFAPNIYVANPPINEDGEAV